MSPQELKLFAEHVSEMQGHSRIFFVGIDESMTGGYGDGVAAVARRDNPIGPEFQCMLFFERHGGHCYQSGWKQKSAAAIDKVLELAGLPVRFDRYHQSDLRMTILRRTKGINER